MCSNGIRGAVGGLVTGGTVPPRSRPACWLLGWERWSAASRPPPVPPTTRRRSRSPWTSEVDSLQPVPRASWRRPTRCGPHLRLHDQLVDEGHVARARPGDPNGRPRTTAGPGRSTSVPEWTWSDGEPLTAADIAYTYNRVLTGDVEGGDLGVVPRRGHEGDRTRRRHTSSSSSTSRTAVLPLLPIPIVPEHIWKDVTRRRSRTTPPSRRTASRSSGRDRSGSSRARPTGRRTASRRTPTTGRARLTSTRSCSRSTRAWTPRSRPWSRATSTSWRASPRSRSRHSRARPGSPRTSVTRRASTRSRSTPARSTLETGKPIGDPHPVLLDAEVPPRARLRDRPAGASSTRSTRVAVSPPSPRSSRRPTRTSNGIPPADEAFTFDLERAGQLLDDAGYELGDDGKRTMPDGSPIGKLRIAARTDGPYFGRCRELLQGVVRAAGSGDPGRGLHGEPGSPTSFSTATTTCSSGAGTSSPTRTRCSATSPVTSSAAGRTRGTATEEYDALYAAQHCEMDQREAPGDRQADAADHLRGFAVPPDVLPDLR